MRSLILFFFCEWLLSLKLLFFFLLRGQKILLMTFLNVTHLSLLRGQKRKKQREKAAVCTSGATPRGVGLKQKNSLRSNSFCFFTPSFPLYASHPYDEAGNYFKWVFSTVCKSEPEGQGVRTVKRALPGAT